MLEVVKCVYKAAQYAVNKEERYAWNDFDRHFDFDAIGRIAYMASQ